MMDTIINIALAPIEFIVDTLILILGFKATVAIGTFVILYVCIKLIIKLWR